MSFAKMISCGHCGEPMENHTVAGPCPRDMPKSAHPRIDDALAQMRLQFPTMPNAEQLDLLARPKGTRWDLTLADGSKWALIDIDLEADTLKLWRMR